MDLPTLIGPLEDPAGESRHIIVPEPAQSSTQLRGAVASGAIHDDRATSWNALDEFGVGCFEGHARGAWQVA